MGTREGQMKRSPERRREISAMGGRANIEKNGRSAMRIFGRLGGEARKRLPPERRSELARAGALALNAKRTPEQHSKDSRRGGYWSHKKHQTDPKISIE